MSTAKIIGRDPRNGRSIGVTVEDGIITRIEETKSDTDLYLSAGFVDLQVNGRAGFDLNVEQISTDTVIGLVDVMLADGVTCFVPTLITAPEVEICDRLKVIAEARSGHRKVCLVCTVRSHRRTAYFLARRLPWRPSRRRSSRSIHRGV
jgi:N-acetylglucosamine-6-phosphate deacetylase